MKYTQKKTSSKSYYVLLSQPQQPQWFIRTSNFHHCHHQHQHQHYHHEYSYYYYYHHHCHFFIAIEHNITYKQICKYNKTIKLILCFVFIFIFLFLVPSLHSILLLFVSSFLWPQCQPFDNSKSKRSILLHVLYASLNGTKKKKREEKRETKQKFT